MFGRCGTHRVPTAQRAGTLSSQSQAPHLAAGTPQSHGAFTPHAQPPVTSLASSQNSPSWHMADPGYPDGDRRRLLWVNPCGPRCRGCSSPTLPGPFPMPPRTPYPPGVLRGGGSCSLPTASGSWCWPPLACFTAPRLPAAPCSVNIPPAATRPMCIRLAPVSLSHQRDLGMPEPGCCQRHSEQRTQRWHLSLQPAAGLAPLLCWL